MEDLQLNSTIPNYFNFSECDHHTSHSQTVHYETRYNANELQTSCAVYLGNIVYNQVCGECRAPAQCNQLMIVSEKC